MLTGWACARSLPSKGLFLSGGSPLVLSQKCPALCGSIELGVPILVTFGRSVPANVASVFTLRYLERVLCGSWSQLFYRSGFLLNPKASLLPFGGRLSPFGSLAGPRGGFGPSGICEDFREGDLVEELGLQVPSNLKALTCSGPG